MRHLGEVGRYKMAFHILAHACEHRVRIIPCLVRAKHVAKHHGFTVGVRYFDADGGLAFDHRQDAHVGTGHRVGDVLLQIGDLLHFHTRTKLHLIHGHGWASQKADDFSVDIELLECDRKRANHTIVLRSVHGMRRALLQHAEIRQMVGALRNLTGLVGNALSVRSGIQIVHDLIGRRIDHDLRSVGCAVLVDDRPRVPYSHANGFDLVGRRLAGNRRNGFRDLRHGAARQTDWVRGKGTHHRRLRHGDGSTEILSGMFVG